MGIYGYVRCCAATLEKTAEAEIQRLARKAIELGGRLSETFVERGDSGQKTAVLARPTGRQMLATLNAGDTLIVARLDRLGYSMLDVHKTLAALGERAVRIYAIHALHGELDLKPDVTKVFLQFFDLWARTERALRSERFTGLARWRKENGLAYGGVPTARRIVERNGVKVLEWDYEQLGYIAEIAHRLPREGAAQVAADFWKRRIKDRRGRLWGRRVPESKPRSPGQQAVRALGLLVGRRDRTVGPYQQFYRAARWFHRMKWKGLLPPSYCDLAASMPDPKGYGAEPKPRKWTPGGTARREQERAEAKAQHRAERLARWQGEKAARIESRLHKPMLAGAAIAPMFDESPTKEA